MWYTPRMATTSAGRQNLVAGVFVLAGIVLAVATLVVIQQLTLSPRVPYDIEFTVEEGVGGLATGSDVQVGGLSRGKVVSVTPRFADASGGDRRMTGVVVRVEIDESIEIFDDASVLRMSPLLGTIGFLNFTNLGGGEGAARLSSGGTLDARPSPGMLATIVGGQNAEAVGLMIANVERLSDVLGEQIPRDYDQIVRPALRDAGTVIGDVRQKWPSWSGEITTTLDNAAVASASIVKGIDQARNLVASAQKPVDGIAVLVEDNTPAITRTVQNALDISRKVDDLATSLEQEALPKLTALLDSAKETLDGASATLERIEPEILRQMPQVRSIISDIRDASSELKLSMIEIRRNPWRLLFRPSSEIVGNENLFAAARNFAIAAGDLRMAGEAFEEVLAADPDALADDPDLADSLREAVGEQFRRYERAQQDLFRIILAEPVDGDRGGDR
jgi:ABC-type transporter Mla subunit MlaD